MFKPFYLNISQWNLTRVRGGNRILTIVIKNLINLIPFNRTLPDSMGSGGVGSGWMRSEQLRKQWTYQNDAFGAHVILCDIVVCRIYLVSY